MYVIGVDFGVSKDDFPMVSVFRTGEVENEYVLIESCKVEDFDYSKYMSSNHQMVGEKIDLEKFYKYFNRNGFV